MISRSIIKTSPARIILASIIATIGVGTALLALPWSRTVPIPFLDLFFTACSVTCVTGLLAVPLQLFTPFGQCIIALLTQIGGLGVITLTLFLMSLFVEFGFGTQLIAGQLLELESWKNIKKLIFFIISFTMIVELLGAFIIFYAIHSHYALHKTVFLSLFHAISAFCDAGLSFFPNSLVTFQTNKLLLLITTTLMLIGGLGFITWHELYIYVIARINNRRRSISLHSKIVLMTSAIIIIISAVLFWLLEWHHSFAHMSYSNSIINALFNAIASRSTGFYTVPIPYLQPATLFMIMIISFIGSSPGSTGSGIKTTTFAIIIASIKATLHNKTMVSIKGRSIARNQILKAFTIMTLSASWIVIIIFCLLLTEKSLKMADLIFEAVSAFATLGLSTGITPLLSSTGKLLIIASMIAGRIGIISVVLALYKRPDTTDFSYPEERIMLG